MNPTRDLLTATRQCARQLKDQAIDQPIPPSEIALLLKNATHSQRAETISALTQEAQECLDRAPHEACSLARTAHELARAGEDTRQQAETALRLATALNRMGEFREARQLADETAHVFARDCEEEKAAQSLCEAAWADTFIGDLDPATAKVNRARAMTTSSLLQARCDWIEARVFHDQARYVEAAHLLEKARDLFQAAELPLEAARCERELAYGYILAERGKAFPVLKQVRQTFETAGCVLDAALCDYLLASSLNEAGRYAETPEIALSARQKFTNLRSSFFVAWCDLTLGVAYRHLNRFDDSLHASHRARDQFLVQGIRSQVAACCINLGSTYYVLNRYDDALMHYQEAADLSLAEGREARAARLYINMGLVYAKQGRYSQALDLHFRALQIATSKDLALLVAGCHLSLAACYREFGQYAEALAHFRCAQEATLRHPQREALIQCNIDLAEIHQALGETAQAVACLEQARSVAAEDGLDSLVAVCDRLLAQATVEATDRAQALARIEHARTLFLKHAQTVDAALCDLTEGELQLQSNEMAAARECFQRARGILLPAFPDQAWRADYGLGRCAAISDHRTAALDHYLRAVRTIAAARSALVTEQLSNDFFARRQSIYDEALSQALRQDAREAALEVIEASKARTFLTLIQQRGWKVRRVHHDPYIAELVAQEKHLRYQLNTLKGRIAVQVPRDVDEAFRSVAELSSISAAALQELNAVSKAYEAVATQLRLATTGLAGVAAPLPFALEKFQAAANETWGSDWAALDYYLAGDSLTVVVVYPNQLETVCHRLSAFDRAVLEKCTRTDSDMREWVYRSTSRGAAVPSPGVKYLQHLYRLLIPPGLFATTLIVSPHGPLHALPFQALMDRSIYLVERHSLLCTPSLQVLQHLLGQPIDNAVSRPLVMGISQFGERARALPFASAEVDRLHEIFDGRGQFLREDEATRQHMIDLNASGELEKFDLVHLASHAIIDHTAPHQSRVLLHDDALTALDILDLSLNARLVALSACQTALGHGGNGDEWIGLASAFFYAGTQALLVALWSVEDNAVVELTERFYRHWIIGKDAATSLRQASIEMIRAGHPPYRWAPFVLLGRP